MFVLPFLWDTYPISQVYLPALNLPVPKTPESKEALSEQSVLPKNVTQSPCPGIKSRPLDLELSDTILSARPYPQLHITVYAPSVISHVDYNK